MLRMVSPAQIIDFKDQVKKQEGGVPPPGRYNEMSPWHLSSNPMR
jgi:hypothetical protein